MSAKPTMYGIAAVVTKRHAPWTAAVTTVLIALAGWINSQSQHDGSDTIRREMHKALVTLSAEVEKQDDLIRELQITVAVLEDRWESEGADTVTTVERLPPPPRPRLRPPHILSYDALMVDLAQRRAE